MADFQQGYWQNFKYSTPQYSSEEFQNWYSKQQKIARSFIQSIDKIVYVSVCHETQTAHRSDGHVYVLLKCASTYLPHVLRSAMPCTSCLRTTKKWQTRSLVAWERG